MEKAVVKEPPFQVVGLTYLYHKMCVSQGINMSIQRLGRTIHLQPPSL